MEITAKLIEVFDGRPPRWEEAIDGPRDLDTQECLNLVEGRRICEVDRTMLMDCTFCFSFLSSRFLRFYLPAFIMATIEHEHHQHWELLVDRILDVIGPGSYLETNWSFSLNEDQRNLVQRWLDWLIEASEGAFAVEASAIVLRRQVAD